MLTSLTVRDFVLIEEAELQLDGSFVVLTGETGAGKSLLVDAVGLLLGGRANSNLIRSGAKRLLIEGEFDVPVGSGLIARLEEAGIPVNVDEAVILRREVAVSGRSRAWINGSQVGVGFLSEVAVDLARIRGQNEAPDLADPRRTLDTLDRYAQLETLRAEVGLAFGAWSELASKLEKLHTGEREREARLDFARFQLEEIEKVSPKTGEEEELAWDRSRLAHAARIREVGGAALDAISEGEDSGIDRLGVARRELHALAGIVPDTEEMVRELDELGERVQDLSRRIGSLAQEAEDDPERLAQIEDRLDQIRRLLRKHGGTVSELLEKQEQLRLEVEELAGASSEITRIEPALAESLRAYSTLADRISASRRAAAPRLTREVRRHLVDLAMESAELELTFTALENTNSSLERDGKKVSFSAVGYDKLELLARTNPGEPPRVLNKVASGGELSRLQLALAVALLGNRARTGLTLVFDEIDAGVGGAAAVSVARKLSELAKNDQVLCVTHLASIAARSDCHYRIEKATDGESTTVRVTRLKDDDRVAELARMLAGEPDGREAREHARALLQEA